MSETPILLPCAGLAGLTAAVWVRLYWERIGEMRAKRIAPQALSTSAQARDRLQLTCAADNFRNLFEMPVLFYALCLGLAVAGLATPLFVAMAWTYVVLRALHSFIHTTYNRVMHRFTVYAASSVLLFAMWGLFAARLLAAG
ncbi:MAG TPA: MAPEG family protein [Gammaproteobacteria bacterium]|nr:MAPEG family protein [Gammaproteobacteria bacterium]